MKRDDVTDWRPSQISRGHTVPPPRIGARRPGPPARRLRHTRAVRTTLIGVLILTSLTAALFVVRLATSNAGARTPGGAVREFLVAVARADGARALRFQQAPPARRTLLSDAVLGRTRAFAPITDIRVESATAAANLVVAHFRTGGEPVRAAWPVARQADHTWKVVRGTSPITVAFPNNLPVVIDGVRLDTTEAEVFPGRHRIGTGTTQLSYHPGDTFVAPGGQAIHLAPAPALTDAGRDAVAEAARGAWQRCLQQRSLSPPGCPQHVSSGEAIRFDPATIRWSADGDPFAQIVPTLSFEDAARAEFPVHARLRLRVWATREGYSNEIDQEIEVNTVATANLLTNPVQVDFRK